VVTIRIVTLLPYGGWIKFAVVLWGLGAISLALYKRLQRTPSIPIPPPMAA